MEPLGILPLAQIGLEALDEDRHVLLGTLAILSVGAAGDQTGLALQRAELPRPPGQLGKPRPGKKPIRQHRIDIE